MTNRLVPIVAQKKQEILALEKLIQESPQHLIAQILQGKIKRESKKNFKKALSNTTLSVIAEIKRQSPSKGKFASISDPVSLAKLYQAAGASAISILTDERFFGGTLQDLVSVSKALQEYSTAILRKDFIIDQIQIAEAIYAGADAILCIVAITGNHTKALLSQAKAMNIDVLVEVYDQSELDIAIESGAEIIAVNNRDLTTFEVDTHRALTLLEHIPNSIVKVAASGIFEPELAQEYYRKGFDAVLIGEALVTSPDPEKFIRVCRDTKTLD